MDVDFRCLTVLKRLQQVDFERYEGSTYKTPGFDGLADVSQLTALNITRFTLQDADFQKLGGLTQLQILKCIAVSVTDTGLEYLGKMTQLQHLKIDVVGASHESYQKLQAKLPFCSFA